MSASIPFRFARRDMLRLTAGAGLLTAVPELAWAQAWDVKSLKIATIGSGREGGALGTLFAQAGHKVMFSSRHPENPTAGVREAPRHEIAVVGSGGAVGSMGIRPQQASLGWCIGGTGLGGSDRQQGVGGQLDERKERRGVGRRLL
jgi:hypothetical protein